MGIQNTAAESDDIDYEAEDEEGEIPMERGEILSPEVAAIREIEEDFIKFAQAEEFEVVKILRDRRKKLP